MKNFLFLTRFGESDFQETYNKGIWLYIIITITIISFVIGNFSISHGSQELFSFLFFIPIILTAYYFPRQGIVVSFAIGIGYIILNGVYLIHQPLYISRALLVSSMFIGIGGLISILSENLTGLKRKYQEIIDVSEAGIVLIDADTGVIRESNPAFQRIVGCTAADLNNMAFTSYWTDITQYNDITGSIRTNGAGRNVISSLISRSGEIRDVLISGRIFERDRILFTLIDISEQIRAQKELENSEHRYRLLVETAQEGVVVCDSQGVIQFANRKMGELLGYDVADIIDSSLYRYIEPENWPTLTAIFSVPIQPSRHQHEIDLITQNGESLHVILSTSTLNSGPYTTAVTPDILALVSDITERKRYEDQLEHSLREKEVLIQEIHHRVKNNMSVICSLLQLDSLQTDDPVLQVRLHKTESRVKSMALVHEKLYQSKETGSIDFNDYVRSLIADVIAFSGKDSDIVVRQDIEDLQLTLDQAIPCGLIINELLTNSLKHAFPPGMGGNVFITGRFQHGNLYSLDFSDDGSGISPEVNMVSGTTLGMRLIMVLVRQIEGEFEVLEGTGAAFRITFHVRRPEFPGLTTP